MAPAISDGGMSVRWIGGSSGGIPCRRSCSGLCGIARGTGDCWWGTWYVDADIVVGGIVGAVESSLLSGCEPFDTSFFV